jgi:hypothetical protein
VQQAVRHSLERIGNWDNDELGRRMGIGELIGPFLSERRPQHNGCLRKLCCVGGHQ